MNKHVSELTPEEHALRLLKKRQWRWANRQKVLLESRRYYERHRESCKAYTKKWKRENNDKVCAYKRNARLEKRSIEGFFQAQILTQAITKETI